MELRITNCKLLMVALAFAGSVAHASEVIDRVLAIVGGAMITLTDVTAARDLGLIAVPAAADPVREILPRLIDRELILAEVDRYAPPEPSAEAVDAQMLTVRERFSSDEAFQTALTRSGINENHLRETLRQNLRIQAYLDQRFGTPVFTDDELGRYYREHLPAFTRGGTVVSLEAAREQVVQAATLDRREQLVDEWVGGLRRRSDIIDLSLTQR